MSKVLDERSLVDLGKRVYNGKMIEQKNDKGETVRSDEQDIKRLCQKVFGDGSVNPDPSLLHQFNNILVKTADYVAEPTIKEMLGLLSNFQSVKINDYILYDVPQIENKPVIMFSARGATADLVRLGQDKRQVPAQRQVFSFGVYYEPLDFINDSVKAYNETINKLAEEKVKKYFTLVTQCLNAAIATGKIPTKNNLIGAGLSLSNYKKLENRFIRWGGKPMLIADTALIDHFAQQQANTENKELLTDELRKELREALNISKFSKTTAFNINNPYLDLDATKTQYPINEGYIFAGAMKGKKPVYVTEFGGTRQTTEKESNIKRVKMQIDFEADVSLMHAHLIGKIKDTSLSL